MLIYCGLAAACNVNLIAFYTITDISHVCATLTVPHDNIMGNKAPGNKDMLLCQPSHGSGMYNVHPIYSQILQLACIYGSYM